MPAAEALDFQDLVSLARNKSVSARARLVQIVGDLYFDEARVLGTAERALMVEIMGRLIHDVEIEVRRVLAERLAEEPGAPAELVRTLANDTIEVARPVLMKSPVLLDIELIEVIHHRTVQHQLAIALRPRISVPVSDALVESGAIEVVRTLIENPTAELSKAAKAYLVEESRRVDCYRRPLVMRADLGRDLAKRLYLWVSAALRQHIVAQFEIDPAELDTAIQESVEHMLDARHADPRPIRAAAQLALKLKSAEAISPQLLIQALRVGEVALFEDLLSQLSGVRPQLVRRFIYEPGGEGLAIACKAAGIDTADFATIFLQSRGARPGEKIVDPDELSRALRFYARVSRQVAAAAVRRWRLDPDYQFALEQVGDIIPARQFQGRS